MTVATTCRRVLVLAATALATGCGAKPDAKSSAAAPLLSPARIEELRPQVVAYCGACHNTPNPASFPRDAWIAEVEQGYRFGMKKKELIPPPQHDVTAWFRSQAPIELTLAEPVETPSSLTFRRQGLALSSTDQAREAAISSLHWLPAQNDQPAQLLFTDMRHGLVGGIRFGQSQPHASLFHPCLFPAHVTPTDLDQDGVRDFLVAELGTYLPGDHDQGQVVWLQPRSDGSWQRHELLTNVGRVADVQPADLDHDGDLDLIVAEFGWRTTGSISLLIQQKRTEGVPVFERRLIDERHGTIHVPVADLDGDGDLDFVALISQEHEEVDAFLSNGQGQFERQVLHLSGDPAYGSSGMQLVDLDQDGDLDVLLSNGDTLDAKHLKPYHSVQWLENEGDYPFRHHHITPLPGVTRALASDLDGDGDLDIVACAWLVPEAIASRQKSDYASLIWLENVGRQEFRRHPLATTPKEGFMALELADFDSDGDLDIAAGLFGRTATDQPMSVEFFWNNR